MKISTISKIKLSNGRPWKSLPIFVVFLFSMFFLHDIFAVSFNIDSLNLQEAFPVPNFPRAYFKVGLKEAWTKVNEMNPILSRVSIGIIDTGFDGKHPEFAGVEIGDTPIDAKIDSGELIDGQLTSHGTNIAGIIGANNISATSSANYVSPQMNGILSGVKNLNYELKIRSRSKKLDRFTAFSSFKKITDVIDSGASVVNLSFAGFNPIGSLSFNTIFLSHPNVLFVVSAGNNNTSVNFQTPANLGFMPNVITVGATSLSDQRAAETNFGFLVGVSAPGEDVYTPTFFTPPLPLDSQDYEFFDGTSASAPMVTGVAGLLKAIKPNLTPAQIKQIIIETADPIQTGEPTKRIGTGCYSNPNDPVNTGCRLNALKAVCHPLVLNCQPTFPPAVCPLSGVLETSSTITSQNTCIIQGILTVPVGVTLRADPGAVIKFSDGELHINGALKAEGTALNPVFFTSIKDDAVGGDTNNDGSATFPQPMDWGAIRVQDGTADFIHSVVRYGGLGFYASGLSSENGNIFVSNSRFSKNFARNLDLSNSTTTVSFSEIDNAGVGILPSGGILTVNNTNFHNNGHPLFLSPQQNFIHSNNTAVNNSINGIIINGVLTSNRHWNKDNIPYVVFSGPATGTPATSTILVSSGATLNIDPGAVVKFAFPSSEIIVQGTLNASGTQSQPIFFTSIKDDTIGGDTNNDGNSTSPQPEDWLAIEILNSTANFSHSVIRYGGGQPSLIPTGLFAQGSIVSLLNSHLTRNFARNLVSLFGTTTIISSEIDNSGTGIEQAIGSASITNSSIHDNTSFGARVFGPFPMNAVNNWWGSATGPFHPTLNPSGTGNAVSDNVNFIPFLTSDPVGNLP